MAYAIVRTDLMQGTVDPSALVSIRYAEAIENGNVLAVGALADGEREVRVGGKPKANAPLIDIVLIASPELIYEDGKCNLNQYINKENFICRGYRMKIGNIFSVTKEALDGTPKVGSIVELQAGTKLKSASSLTTGSTMVGEIIAREHMGAETYYVIEIQ